MPSLDALTATKSWLNTIDGSVLHWTIESVDDDMARGFARVSTLVDEDVIDDDVEVVLTASESGSGTITFGSAQPMSARWSADELIVEFPTGARSLTPTTQGAAAAARDVLVDAAEAARVANVTTLAPSTTTPIQPEPLIGVLTLTSSDLEGDQETCRGTGGYADVGAGMNVTVRDGTGAIVATANTRNLSSGDDIENADDASASIRTISDKIMATAFWPSVCYVWFVADVPETAFYEIEVGARGSLALSFNDLVRQEWKVELALG